MSKLTNLFLILLPFCKIIENKELKLLNGANWKELAGSKFRFFFLKFQNSQYIKRSFRGVLVLESILKNTHGSLTFHLNRLFRKLKFMIYSLLRGKSRDKKWNEFFGPSSKNGQICLDDTNNKFWEVCAMISAVPNYFLTHSFVGLFQSSAQNLVSFIAEFFGWYFSTTESVVQNCLLPKELTWALSFKFVPVSAKMFLQQRPLTLVIKYWLFYSVFSL